LNRTLIAFLALLIAAPAAASGSPDLHARPIATAPGLPSGRIHLAYSAIAYVPASIGRKPMALIVLLHGYGEKAGDYLDRFTAEADSRGVILLTLQSKGPTWDLIPQHDGGQGPLAMKSVPALRFGADVARIDAVLNDLFSRTTVDARHIVLLGFSDGASYALSLGLANPQLFSTVLSFSPGFVVIPKQVAPSQRIFIAHGRQDQVLPFHVAEKDIAGLIAANHLKPVFRPFDGDHHIDDGALADGLAYALGSAEPAPRL
jgi:predicted esterase